MLRIATALFALVLAGCAHAAMDATDAASHWQHARQMVVVTTGGWDDIHGRLRTFERIDGGDWREAGIPRAVVIGRTGAAWGIGLHDIPTDDSRAGDAGPVKREGDGRSPAGVFTVGEAFGYAPSAATGLRYDAMDAGDYCVDVSGSPYYNRIVDSAQVGTDAIKDSTEPMRRDLHADGDQRYRLGFVIEHNPQGTAMGGSCIFGHLWKTPDTATSGCTAMAPDSMQWLLGWLDAKSQPVFVLLPIDEYRKLQAAWQLPRLS
jgi:L,D-peptidoglycan transpeptidase YkuD (ErfK/YbiS/YcfS/YnhG family)